MTKATSEQFRVFRHRRLMVQLTNVGILFAGFILMVGLLSLSVINRNGRVAIFVGFGTVLFTWTVGRIFTFTYFRCPICGHPIPSRGYTRYGWSLGNRCDKCDVVFTA
jgi:hypothetical protein